MTPHFHLKTIQGLARDGVRPLHSVTLWRQRSTHEMGALLLAKAGIQCGANFYNGVHLGWAIDGNTDEFQTRLVITTDAHVLNPDRLVLIPNVQPRNYLGGHNTAYVTDPKDLVRLELGAQPSVIVTLTHLHYWDELSFPISFRNQVPAQIDLKRTDGMLLGVDISRQGFPEEEFYANFVYADLYKDQKIERFGAASILDVSKMSFQAPVRENHVAMQGCSVRYDYHTRSTPGPDFLDFNDFMQLGEAAVDEHGLDGVIQIASFHPRFQFEGTAPDDMGNFTNRAPFPTLHLLREASIERAVAAFPDADTIGQRNIGTLVALGHAGWDALWTTSST